MHVADVVVAQWENHARGQCRVLHVPSSCLLIYCLALGVLVGVVAVGQLTLS